VGLNQPITNLADIILELLAKNVDEKEILEDFIQNLKQMILKH